MHDSILEKEKGMDEEAWKIPIILSISGQDSQRTFPGQVTSTTIWIGHFQNKLQTVPLELGISMTSHKLTIQIGHFQDKLQVLPFEQDISRTSYKHYHLNWAFPVVVTNSTIQIVHFQDKLQVLPFEPDISGTSSKYYHSNRTFPGEVTSITIWIGHF